MFDGHFTDDTALCAALIWLPIDLVSLFFTIPEFHLGLDVHSELNLFYKRSFFRAERYFSCCLVSHLYFNRLEVRGVAQVHSASCSSWLEQS